MTKTLLASAELRTMEQGAVYHDEVGYNSRLDEIQAAVLNVKFKRIDSYNESRRKNAALYIDTLLHRASDARRER